MITVAGSINMDLVARVPHIPAPGETVLGGCLLRCHGGKGANQAVAAARMGAAVACFGAVGRDDIGAELIEGLQREGIDTAGVHRVDAASGCALISVADDGEDAIAVLPGANALVAPPAPDWHADRRSDWLVLQLEIPAHTCLAWARAAHAAGVPVLLNAAPMQALPDALLACIDTLVVNERELAALVGADAGDAPQQVARRGPRRVVATQGARGGRAWDGVRLLQWPAHAVCAVDSTGAGDTFVGALAAGLAAREDFEIALRRAAVAAALSCSAQGARAGMPTRAAVDAAMR